MSGPDRIHSPRDLERGREVLVEYDETWWPSSVRKNKRERVQVTVRVMGSPVRWWVTPDKIAVRPRPDGEAPPPDGARVLGVQRFEMYSEIPAGDARDAVARWEPGRVVARDGDRAKVRFEDGETEWLPPQAIACFADGGGAGSHGAGSQRGASQSATQRISGVIRREDGGAGPVYVASRVSQRGEQLRHNTFAATGWVEREDGSTVALDFSGRAPELAPQRDERGDWQELSADPLSAPFVDFAPGPHETFEIEGVALVAGDRVDIVGDVVQTGFANDHGGGYRAGAQPSYAIRPAMIAVGDNPRARGELIDAWQAKRAGAQRPAPAPKKPERPRRSVRQWLYDNGFLVPLLFALAGLAGWLSTEHPILRTGGAMWFSYWLAAAVYQYRGSRRLTRFHRLPPRHSPPLGTGSGGATEVGLRSKGWVYFTPVMVFPALAGAFVEPRWTGMIVLIAVGGMIAALFLHLLLTERHQARTLRILARAKRGAIGTWGAIEGTVAEGALNRRIDVVGWSESRQVTETVKTESGGTTQVTRTVNDYYNAGRRHEDVSSTLEVDTMAGRIRVQGCNQAPWGTARTEVEIVPPSPDSKVAQIRDAIGVGDSVLIFGRAQPDPQGGPPVVAHTGPGSLMIYGAPSGTSARSAARRAYLGHLLALALIAASIAPLAYRALVMPAEVDRAAQSRSP